MNIKNSKALPFAVMLSAALFSTPFVASAAQNGPDKDKPNQAQSHQQGGNSHGNAPQQSAPSHTSAPQQKSEPKSEPKSAPQAKSEPAHQSSAHYSFGASEKQQLQAHYKSSLGHVDRAKRPSFKAGEKVPSSYRKYITPAPASIRGHLPTPPSGYTIGYYQGYTVVYDPTTYVILSVLDLLN